MAKKALFNPKTSDYFRNAIPTLEIKTQRRLGTVKVRFFIVEMFHVEHNMDTR